MFTTNDCVPCKQIKATLQSKGFNLDKIEMIYIDTDEGYEKSRVYSVHSVPTVLFVDNGTIMESFCGNSPALSDKIINWY